MIKKHDQSFVDCSMKIIEKTDILIALITKRYNESFVDYQVWIPWKFFYRNMWKFHVAFTPTIQRPFSFQLHPLYRMSKRSGEKRVTFFSYFPWLWVLLSLRNFNMFSSYLPTMIKTAWEGHWKPLISPTF